MLREPGPASQKYPPRRSGLKDEFSWGASRSLTISGLLLLGFRWLVVGCQAATVLITWPLWQVHESPPMLPAVQLPAFDLGIPLLASLALILILPVPGMALHSALLLYAMLIDQTRIQPELVSLAFLMWGSLPNPTARAFAQAHLISLWFFAGVHKLVSAAFMNGTAQWILTGMPITPSAWLVANIGYILALTEITLGVLAFIPRTRTIAAFLAFIVHAGILYVLMPTGHNWNEAVWPWNVALALAGFTIIMPWKSSPFRTVIQCRLVARPLIILLVVAPMGFYVGVTDAYLAHHLYSSNTAIAFATGSSSTEATLNAFNVPMPPEHRLFKQYFRETCQPGDELIIMDNRWWYRMQDLELQQFTCPGT